MKVQARKMLSVFICALAISAITFGIIAAVIGVQKAIDVPAVDAPLDGNLSGGDVTDGNGNEMESGTVYPMSNMVFTVPTALSGTASAGVTITATITPDFATDKKVNWYAEFVNSASTWANGKTVAEYVTVTPTEDGALTATVACSQAFGEQIKIKVVSRSNPESMASCTVDFAQKIQSVSAFLGNFELSNRGESDVSIVINPEGVGVGGVPSVNVVSNDIYTLKETYQTEIRVRRFVLDLSVNSAPRPFFGRNENVVVPESGVKFDRSLFLLVDAADEDHGPIANMDVSDLMRLFDIALSNSKDRDRYVQFHISVKGLYGKYESSVRFNITGYTVQAFVTGVAVDTPTIIF